MAKRKRGAYCRVTVGYDVTEDFCDLTEQVAGRDIHIRLSTGQEVIIETRERDCGTMAISCDGMLVVPVANNCVRITSRYDRGKAT